MRQVKLMLPAVIHVYPALPIPHNSLEHIVQKDVGKGIVAAHMGASGLLAVLTAQEDGLRHIHHVKNLQGTHQLVGIGTAQHL